MAGSSQGVPFDQSESPVDEGTAKTGEEGETCLNLFGGENGNES